MVTIALGSTLSSILLTKDVALLEGVVAFTCSSAQFVASWSSIRSKRFSKLVKAETVLGVNRGAYLPARCGGASYEGEIQAVLRQHGVSSIAEGIASFWRAMARCRYFAGRSMQLA